MKTIKSPRKCLSLLATMLVAVVGIFGLASCERYDLDQRMPSQLGASIYDYLVENGFDTYVKLIDDTTLIDGHQSYHEVMSRTGSKTLFVADEKAVKDFYESGVFKKADGSNVTCYEDLSVAQKKMLLFGAMLDNVYSASKLSSREVEDGYPVEGDCMRRVSLLTEIYDSVSYITPDNMPDNKYWTGMKKRGEKVWCMTDATKRPKVMITPKFLQMHKMTDNDYDFLFHHNDGVHRAGNEVSVNGVKIKLADQRCMNGFVHVMEKVIYPLPNMAEMLAKTENTEVFRAIIDRFSAPYTEFPMDGDNNGYLHTQEFNNLYSKIYKSWQDVDRLYQKRYLSIRSQTTPSEAFGGRNDMAIIDTTEIRVTQKSNLSKYLLKFDIGWNSYFTKYGDIAADIALQKDMAVMLVPDDKAMKEWWNGSPLKERYGKGSTPEERREHKVNTPKEIIEDMAGVPDDVIKDLVNNGLLASLVSSVPSRFDDVMNDAMDQMGINEKDVSDVKICCNGALYITNKIFSPTTYKAVSFPTLVDESLEVVNWAIDSLNFKPYLCSMVSTYSFFIPKGETVADVPNCLVYLSPVITNVVDKYNQVYVFHYDSRRACMTAKIYKADEYGRPTDLDNPVNSNVSNAEIRNILNDMLNNHIVIGDVEDADILGNPSEFNYFKTKGGATVRFEMNGVGQDAGRLVWGGHNLISGIAPSVVNRTYDQRGTAGGNGRAYIIDNPLYTSAMTVNDIVTNNVDYPKFEAFGNLLKSSGLVVSSELYGGDNLSVFNTYHYTVYAPGNEALNQKIRERKIVYGDDLEALRTYYSDLKDEYKLAHKGEPDEGEESLRLYWKELGIRLHKLMRGVPEDAGTINEDTAYTPDAYIADLESELTNFVKYHIQDNSIYVGSDFYKKNGYSTVMYETSYMNVKDNVFHKLGISEDGGTIKIQCYDLNDRPLNVQHYVTTEDDKYYNIMCREYEYKDGYAGINTSSFAVIHLIDSPLDYGKVSKYCDEDGNGYGDRNFYFEIK